MAGFWDDPDVIPQAQNYKRFEAVGDEVEGIVAKLSKRTFNAGAHDERTAVEITWTDAAVPSVTAGQVLLQRALYELKPEPGDRLAIRLGDVEKRGTKTLKRFVVGISRADGTTDLVDQTV